MCVCFRKTLVFRLTILDGSDWPDAVLLLSLAGSVGPLEVMELSHFVLVLGAIHVLHLLHAVPSSCSMLGILLDYNHRLMLDNM